MSIPTAAIIFDSGFSPEVLSKVRHIAGFIDLVNGFMVQGDPYLSPEQRAQITADWSQDLFNHGTVILNMFCEQIPDCPVYLARVITPADRVVRTVFADGQLVQNGWSEAYTSCVQHARKHGMQTVASLSWGGYRSVSDSVSTWEHSELSKLVGAGKKGHVVVAAAGTGSKRGDDESNHADCGNIVEPAVFPEVIAVGLSCFSYASPEAAQGDKPEVILADDEPHRMLSFHVPDAAIRAITLLQEKALDCVELQALLHAEYSRKLES